MTQRTQWIIFAVLLCLLAVIAVITLQSKGQSGAAAPPSSQTGAPGGAEQAASNSESESLDAAQLNSLRDWFDAKSKPSEISPAVADTFGAQPSFEPPSSVKAGGPATAPPLAPAIALVRKVEPPPALQGTLWVNGVGMALFQGEAFRAEEQIRGTACTVTAVDPESVSVKGADGKVITLKLSE